MIATTASSRAPRLGLAISRSIIEAHHWQLSLESRARRTGATVRVERFDGGRPGCMVLDVRLRNESGLDLQEELCRRRSTLPIIVMTGYGDVRTSVRAFKAGAIDFLQKPVPPKKLLERIRSPSTSIGRHARQRRSVPSCSTASPASRRASGRSWTCWRSATVRKRSPRRWKGSVRTVEGHRRVVLRKVGVSSVAHLARAVARLERT